ncbi:hypothetical protein PHISCL_10069, partial [Aspergillus sclerotialis]
MRPKGRPRHDSDHLPLETVLAEPTRDKAIPEKWNWEKADWEKLGRLLVRHLPDTRTLTTKQGIDNAIQALVTAILTA